MHPRAWTRLPGRPADLSPALPRLTLRKTPRFAGSRASPCAQSRRYSCGSMRGRGVAGLGRTPGRKHRPSGKPRRETNRRESKRAAWTCAERERKRLSEPRREGSPGNSRYCRTESAAASQMQEITHASEAYRRSRRRRSNNRPRSTLGRRQECARPQRRRCPIETSASHTTWGVPCGEPSGPTSLGPSIP